MKIVIIGILILCIGYVSWRFGIKVKASNQLEIYKTLLIIASIVFAIMGAWLSILKIEITQGVKLAVSNEEGDEHVNKARKLISPMSSSVFVIILTLVFIFSYYIFKDFHLLRPYTECLRGISFFFLSVLTFWQLVALSTVMLSGIDFLLGISRENMERRGNRNR